MRALLRISKTGSTAEIEFAALEAANWFSEDNKIVEQCALILGATKLDYAFFELIADARRTGIFIDTFNVRMAEATALARCGLHSLARRKIPTKLARKSAHHKDSHAAGMGEILREGRKRARDFGISSIEDALIFGDNIKAAVLTRSIIDKFPSLRLIPQIREEVSDGPKILYLTRDVEAASFRPSGNTSIQYNAITHNMRLKIPRASVDVVFFDKDRPPDIPFRPYDIVIVQPYPANWSNGLLEQQHALRLAFGAGEGALQRLEICALQFPEYATQVGARFSTLAPSENDSLLLDFARRCGNITIVVGEQSLVPSNGRLNYAAARRMARTRRESLRKLCDKFGLDYVDQPPLADITIHRSLRARQYNVMERKHIASVGFEATISAAIRAI